MDVVVYLRISVVSIRFVVISIIIITLVVIIAVVSIVFVIVEIVSFLDSLHSSSCPCPLFISFIPVPKIRYFKSFFREKQGKIRKKVTTITKMK